MAETPPRAPKSTRAAGESTRLADETKSAAGESTRPAQLPSLGVRGWLLFLWRQLTSMQTALVLLMLLAIAAVPGSLYPQRSVNPGLTEQYLAKNPKLGKFLDAIGFFDVFSSVWFSAIYLLLFVSLIGCVLPRLQVYLKQLRSQPPRTPRRLTRFTGYTSVDIAGADAEQLQEHAFSALKGSRYRTVRIDEGSSSSGRALSVSAERGYLREFGNLLFHFALVGVLLGVAMGHLTSYRGQVTVVEGEGFSNSLTRYDSFEHGPWFDPATLPAFHFTLDEFRAEFSTNASNPKDFGLPTKFEADVTATDAEQGTFTKTVRVNQPLTLSGAGIYLLGNGYAPVLRVTDRDGTVVHEGPVLTIPQDAHYTSQLVLKMPDARPEQAAIVGIFGPTMTIDEKGPHSQYAGLVQPEVALTMYTGDLGLDGGIPQNVYEVDISTLTPVSNEGGSPALARLAPGEEITLPNGMTVSFLDVKRYAAFDVKEDPWEGFTLVMALLSMGGLVLSLFIPRRRMFVRATATDDGVRLEAAGLARSEDYRLEQDVHDLVARLTGDTADATSPGSTPATGSADTGTDMDEGFEK